LVLLGLFCLVVSACSGVYIIGIVILVACFVAAKIAADASRPSYERNLEQWQRSFLCLRCGNIFVPQALAKAEMVEEQSQEAVARQRALEQARVGRLQLEHAQARAEKRRRTWASSVSAVQSGVRGADRLLLRLAGGAENVLLYRFLRVFTVGLGVILLLLGLSLAGKGVLGLVKLLNSSPPRLYIRMDGQPKELTVDLGNGITLEMVLIPAGEFLMGSNDSPEEKPPHRVRITKPFYLGKYEITQEQWQAVTGNNPSYFKGPKNPVERVSWGDCQEFIKKLNERVSGGRFSLPTEAQWEYACRAGSTARYSFGNDEAALGRYAWYKGNSNSSTHPAGEKQPNAWGLYDMHGNVSEWCADSLDDSYYSRSPEDDPAGPETGAEHVYRGGGWGELAEDCRSALRLGDEPGFHNLDLGLRVSLVPADK
jgi:formylglycine-generating enzyme required for sulfatase activity